MTRPHTTGQSTTAARRAASLRPIGMPRALEVRANAEGMPLEVTRTDARGRRAAPSPVESVEEVWRVAEAWWRESPQARTYYRVILDGGRTLTLYRDEVTGAWFEQPYSPADSPASGAPR